MMNLPTLLVLLLVLLLAVAAVRAMSRKRDICNSPCNGCSCRDLCEKRKD